MSNASSQQEPLAKQIVSGFSRYTLVLIVMLAVASVIGAADSVRDGAGDRLLGALPVAVPSVVGVWAALELLWRNVATPLPSRLFVAAIFVPLPNAVISALAWGVCGLTDHGQQLIDIAAEGEYDHYYWPRDARSPGSMALTFFGGWGIAGFFALMALLIVVLPLLAYLRSREVLAGTDLSMKKADLAGNVRAIRCAFGALSISAVAAIVWAARLSDLLVGVLAAISIVLLGLAATFAVRRT